MIHGEVVGEIWATVKVSSLTGLKLLVVRPAGDVSLGKSAQRLAADIVAADLVGAGVGERVIVALGKAARLALGAGENVAIEAAIVGIVDDLHLRDEPTSPPDDRDVLAGAAETPARPRRARGRKAAESDSDASPPTAAVDRNVDAPTAEVGAATNPEAPSAATTAESRAPLPEKALRKIAAARRPEPDPETGDLFAALEDQATAASEAAPEETEAAAAVEKKPRRPKRAKAAEAASGAESETLESEAAEARGIEYEDGDAGPSFGDLDAIWDGPEGPGKDLEGA